MNKKMKKMKNIATSDNKEHVKNICSDNFQLIKEKYKIPLKNMQRIVFCDLGEAPKSYVWEEEFLATTENKKKAMHAVYMDHSDVAEAISKILYIELAEQVVAFIWGVTT